MKKVKKKHKFHVTVSVEPCKKQIEEPTSVPIKEYVPRSLKLNVPRDTIILTVGIEPDGTYTIRNYWNEDVPDEIYRPMDKEEATIGMVALLNGKRPYRCLDDRDIPGYDY